MVRFIILAQHIAYEMYCTLRYLAEMTEEGTLTLSSLYSGFWLGMGAWERERERAREKRYINIYTKRYRDRIGTI